MTAPLKLTTSMPQNVMIDAINQNFRQIEGESRRKVVTDEDGKDRIIIGRKEDGGYSIKVSDAGYDVNTATDDQLVMNSDWNMWKIVASGSTLGIAYAATKRNSSLVLNTTNIGYISDICIPIRNSTVPAATIFDANAKPQIFVRDTAYKKLMNYTNVFYTDGTNQVDVIYSFFLWGKYLVVRTTLRLVRGSVTLNPGTEQFEGQNFYWEIANATRLIPGGMGGGGSLTGQYVYYDSVTANPYTNDLPGLNADYVTRSTVSAGTYSSIYSYTYQFFDSNYGNHFPHGLGFVPVTPAVDVDN
jgi:hypothetical protein